MPILDIHTHLIPIHPFQAIRSLDVQDLNEISEGYFSVGLHPWHICQDTLEANWDAIVNASSRKDILALGETGLDKLCDTPYSIQLDIFKRHIELSEKIGKPLIIHCVHSLNELLELKKEYAPRQPWIWHGFRGKKEIAMQCVSHGLYLSFGERYQEEALKNIPISSFFLETDENNIDIYTLCNKVAALRQIPIDEFMIILQANIERVFSYR